MGKGSPDPNLDFKQIFNDNIQKRAPEESEAQSLACPEQMPWLPSVITSLQCVIYRRREVM